MKGRVGGVLEESGNRQNQVKALWEVMQWNRGAEESKQLDSVRTTFQQIWSSPTYCCWSPCRQLSYPVDLPGRLPSFFPPPGFFSFRQGLPLLQVPPPPHLTFSSPRPGLPLWLVPPPLPSSLPPRPGLSLWQVPPWFHPALTWPFPLLDYLHPSSLLPPPCCHPARAGRHGRSNSDLADALLFFFLPCRVRHDSSDGRSRLHTIRTQFKRYKRSHTWGKQPKQSNQPKTQTQTKQTKNKTTSQTIPKNWDHAGETVKHRELVPLKATLICSPQRCSPFHTSLSNFPKQFCIGCIIRFGHVFFRRFWIFKSIDPISGLPFLLHPSCRVFCNFCFFHLQVGTVCRKGLLHSDDDRGNPCVNKSPHIVTLAKPMPVGRRVPCRLRLNVMDIVISTRIGKQSVMNFCRAMYSWPFCTHVCGKEMPIRFQREPHMSGSGKLAV